MCTEALALQIQYGDCTGILLQELNCQKHSRMWSFSPRQTRCSSHCQHQPELRDDCKFLSSPLPPLPHHPQFLDGNLWLRSKMFPSNSEISAEALRGSLLKLKTLRLIASANPAIWKHKNICKRSNTIGQNEKHIYLQKASLLFAKYSVWIFVLIYAFVFPRICMTTNIKADRCTHIPGNEKKRWVIRSQTQ